MELDLCALKQLAEKATGGPWLHAGNLVGTAGRNPDGDEDLALAVAECEVTADARFVAAANPAVVLALIDELDRTRRALVALGHTPPEEPSRSPHAADCAARLTTNGFCTCGFDASHGYGRQRPAEGFRDVGGAREIDLARRAAEEALDEYARLAFGWNEPDDEHTRHSIRIIAERAIRHYDSASSSSVGSDG